MYATKNSKHSDKDDAKIKMYATTSQIAATADTARKEKSPRAARPSSPLKDFFQRNVRWQCKKRQGIQKVKAQQEQQREKELVFKPDVNRAKIEKVLQKRIKRLATLSPKEKQQKDQKQE